MAGLVEWHLGGGAQEATSQRVLPLADPDGNRIVFTGAFPD
jgi:hypothetical protein